MNNKGRLIRLIIKLINYLQKHFPQGFERENTYYLD